MFGNWSTLYTRPRPKGLNGLVNNAGAAFANKALSPDGYERTIAINHVALAALTDGLLDLLRKGADDFAAPSRVVNMTALIESRGKPITDWSYPGKYKQIQAYADAKLLALMYTYAQARRHEGDGLTFNAVSPGAVKTSLGSKAGGPFKTIEALTNPFVGPPEKGSRGCVRLMADPELATATGATTARPSSRSHPRSLVTTTLRTGCTSRPNANCASTTEAVQPAIASTAGAATLAPSLASGFRRG